MGCGCGRGKGNGARRTTTLQPGQTGMIRPNSRQVQAQGVQAQVQAQVQAINRRAAQQSNEAGGMSQERREIEKRRRIQVSLRNRSRRINNPPN